jgi:hypothetical protein
MGIDLPLDSLTITDGSSEKAIVPQKSYATRPTNGRPVFVGKTRQRSCIMNQNINKTALAKGSGLVEERLPQQEKTVILSALLYCHENREVILHWSLV